MGLRAIFALLALLLMPSSASAAGIALDLEIRDPNNADYLEVDVLGNLTEAEAEEGACVWLHADGRAKVHGPTDAPADPDRSEPPRGLDDGGWWYEVTCTDVAGNSILDGRAAASYTGTASHEAQIDAYFLREVDDAVLDRDTVTWRFMGKRHRERTRTFGPGIRQPSKGKPGAPKLGFKVSATHRAGTSGGFYGEPMNDRRYAAARLSLDGTLTLAKGSGKRRGITAGKGHGAVRFIFDGGKQYGARFRLLGGGRYFDQKFGGRDDYFAGPMVQAVQIRLINSTIPGCPKGRVGFLHASHALLEHAVLDLCAERRLWISLDNVKVRITERN